MRISDWSSDVCSSDLGRLRRLHSIEDLVEIYDVRVGLEPVAARLSCPHVELEALAVFEGHFRRFMDNPARDDRTHDEWPKIGAEFHNYFVRCSRNKIGRAHV